MLIHMFNIKTGTSTEWIQFALTVFSTAPIDFLKVVRLVFWSGVVGPGAFARSRFALVQSSFALTVALRAQKLDLWASLQLLFLGT